MGLNRAQPPTRPGSGCRTRPAPLHRAARHPDHSLRGALLSRARTYQGCKVQASASTPGRAPDHEKIQIASRAPCLSSRTMQGSGQRLDTRRRAARQGVPAKASGPVPAQHVPGTGRAGHSWRRSEPPLASRHQTMKRYGQLLLVSVSFHGPASLRAASRLSAPLGSHLSRSPLFPRNALLWPSPSRPGRVYILVCLRNSQAINCLGRSWVASSTRSLRRLAATVVWPAASPSPNSSNGSLSRTHHTPACPPLRRTCWCVVCAGGASHLRPLFRRAHTRPSLL